jgi:hypothetical protein
METVKFIKDDESPTTDKVASQPLNDLLCTEEVQAVKDAMWIMERASSSLMLNTLQKNIAVKSLAVLHKLLDKCCA